nr:MAG TPA: Cytosine specific methyltransferase [Caudoviricetes sp.]
MNAAVCSFEQLILFEECECPRGGGDRYPRYVVWENVPGAFSSNKGADFRSVLEALTEAEIPMPENNKWADSGMVECDKCEIAWRILDAQYWGVAQRRRRIFLVADFGADDRRAEKILFEQASLSRDTEESAEPRQETPRGAKGGARVSSAMGIAVYDMTHADEVMREVKGGKVQTLNARMGTGGNQVPVIHAYAIQGNIIGRQPQNGGNGTGITVDCAPTLTAMDRHAVYASRSYHEWAEDTTGATLRASGGAYGGGSENLAETYGYVRRLTPLECERLQGVPDGWTLIDDASCSDTARYKAIGNGMAQPCADWIMRRIKEVAGNERA